MRDRDTKPASDSDMQFLADTDLLGNPLSDSEKQLLDVMHA